MRLLNGGKLVWILTISAIILMVVLLIIDNWNSSHRDRSTKYDPIDWENIELETIDSKNILMNYFGWINNQACKRPLRVTNSDGWERDGQSICLDPAIVPRADCLVYSFNYYINDSSFENKMKKYGCQVFKFDPDSIISDGRNKLQNRKNRDKKGGRNNLYRFIERLLSGRSRDVDYLKMDIEGEEWDIIPRMLASGSFSKIRQLGVQLHFFPIEDEKTELNYYRELARKIQAFEKKGRMIRFHSKEVNCSFHYGILREKWPADEINKFPTNCFEMAWYQTSN